MNLSSFHLFSISITHDILMLILNLGCVGTCLPVEIESGFGIDDLKVFLSAYLSYLTTLTHCYNYLRVQDTIRTFVAEKVYYGLITPRANQCKTTHDELAAIHLLPKQI